MKNCHFCGNPASDHHHILYRSEGGTDVEVNLLPVCKPCHTRYHSEKGDWAAWGRLGGLKTQQVHRTYLRNLKQYRNQDTER